MIGSAPGRLYLKSTGKRRAAGEIDRVRKKPADLRFGIDPLRNLAIQFEIMNVVEEDPGIDRIIVQNLGSSAASYPPVSF